MNIIELTPENVNEFKESIADIHINSYSKRHFTSTFGLRKLAEYNRLLIINSDISLAVIDGDRRLLAYVISGTAVSRGVSAFVRQNRTFLIRKLLTSPRFLLEKVQFSVRALLTKYRPSSASFRLLSIATAPQAQGTGAGAALIHELENRLRARKVDRYGLSVLTKNSRAVAFYRREGFVHEKDQGDSSYFQKILESSVNG